MKLSLRILALAQAFVSAALLVLPATAQEPSNGEEVVRSRSNAVLVPTLVKDAAGKVVYGLKTEDFSIEDDGVSQKVYLDESPDTAPVSLIIAVQIGRRARHEFGRMGGLASMLDPVLTGPDTEAAILLFDSQLSLAQDFTHNSERIEKDLKDLKAGDGGAAILDAVAYSARLLNQRPEGRQRVLLLISETRDHGSRVAKLDDVVRLVGATNTSVYAVSFSPYASEQLDILRGRNVEERQSTVDILARLTELRNAIKKNAAKALASMTGGECDLFESRTGFEDKMVTFTNHLNSRYLLSFAPKNPHPGLHELRVEVKNSAESRTVIFRRSYWVDEAGQ